MVDEYSLDELPENIVDPLMQFEDREGVFQSIFEINYQSPKIFWRTVKKSHPEFAEFCQKLHSIPAYTNHQTLNLMKRDGLDNNIRESKVKELFYLLKMNETKTKPDKNDS